jgi:hypothetical protein
MNSYMRGNIQPIKPILLAAVITFAVGAELGYGQASIGGTVASSGVSQLSTNATSDRTHSTQDGNTRESSTSTLTSPVPPTRSTVITILPNSSGAASGGIVAPTSGQSSSEPSSGYYGVEIDSKSNPGESAGMSDTALNGTSYGSSDSSTGPPPPPVTRAFVYAATVKPTDYLFLCLSIISCVVAFFMLYQSIALLRMLTRSQQNAPDPDSGTGISWLLFWLVFGICGFYWIANAQREIRSFDIIDFFQRDWWGVALESPRPIAYTFLIAGVTPSIIAIYKFALAIGWLLFRYVRTRGIARFTSSVLTKEDAASTLERIEENINALKSKFSAFENQSTAAGRGNRIINDEIEKKRTDDIRYVLGRTVLLVLIFAVFVWTATFIPVASVLALGAFALVCFTLFTVFGLSKGVQLNQQSLMEVIRLAIKFISPFRFGQKQDDQVPAAAPEDSTGEKVDSKASDGGATTEASSEIHTSGKV